MDGEGTSLPLSSRDILPKNSFDRGLFVLVTGVIPAVVIWNIWLLLNYYSEFSFTACLIFITQCFLATNIIGNFYYLKRVDSSVKRGRLPSMLLTSWKYCPFCQINSPPRSYHCPICDECILRRDQHCMFFGNCVGYFNHRYYFMAVVYVMIGSFLATIFQWPHCLESIGGFHLLPLLSMAAPHIAVLFGFLSIYGFICAVTQIMLCFVFILTFFLFIVQVRCISSGQTIHEKREEITLYDLGIKRNFIQVLGSRWYLVLICPFVSSPLDGDGLNYVTFYDLEEIKNV